MNVRTWFKPLPKWMVVRGILALALVSLPYLLGLLVTPEGSLFTANLISLGDTTTYFADMQLGAHGKWLYTMPYSAQKNTPVPVFMVYVLLGQFARVTHLSIPLVYHSARLVFAALFIYYAYHFVSRFIAEEKEQKLAITILLFTSGIGWLVVILAGEGVLKTSLPDLWWVEATAFSSMLGIPHFVLSMHLMMVMLLRGDDYLQSGKRGDAVLTIATGGILAFVHAHQLVVAGLVLGLLILIRSRMDWGRVAKGVGRMALLFLPLGLLTAALVIATWRDPYLASWLEQGDTYSPPIWTLAVLYGPVLLLTLFGLGHILREKAGRFTLVGLWFVIVLVLLYVPVNFQRRFAEGWHISVAILASLGWYRVMEPKLSRVFSATVARYGLIFLLISVMLSPLLIYGGMLAEVFSVEGESAAYINPDQRGAIAYLSAHADLDDVVLADLVNGNRIPAEVGVRAFLGHWSLTPFYEQRLAEVAAFFNEHTSDAERIDLLKENKITYVYFSQKETELGGFSPEQAAYLNRVYHSPTVSLYRVDLDE